MKVFVIILLIILLPTLCFGIDFTIQWDANTEPDLDHYEVHRAQIIGTNRSGPYSLLDIVDKTITTYTDLIQIDENWTYVVIAVDLAGNRSLMSNSVWYWDRHSPDAPQNVSGDE